MASVTEEIAIKLGIKNADLKAVLADSGAAIKTFKKTGESTGDDGLLGTIKKQTRGLNDLKQLLTGGAMAGAVKGFFNLAIESANKSTDANDQNARAVREFGRSLEDMKGIAGKVAVAVVGFFNRIGEAAGDWQNKVDAFYKGGPAAVEEYNRVEKIVVETARAAEEIEKRLADTRKRHGAEFLSITKQLQQLEEKTADLRQKALTPMQQEQDLLVKAVKLRDELVAYEGEAIGRRRLELQIAETGYKLLEATGARKKEQADIEEKRIETLRKEREEETKMYEEAYKAAEDRKQARALDKGEEVELFLLRNKNSATLTTADRARLAVLELQKKEKAAAVEIEELEAKIIDGTLTPSDKKRLVELVKQKETIDKQLAAKQAMTGATNQQIAAEQQVVVVLTEELRIQKMLTEENERQAQIEKSRTGTIKQTGDVRNLSDVQLDQLILNLNQQISSMKAQFPTFQGAGGKKPIEQVLFEQNLQAAIKERSVRRDFSNTVSFFGQDKAERDYAPNEYNRLSQLLNPDQMKKDSNNLAVVATGLAALMPEKFLGAIR
jgi:hypothetical protein